MSVSINLKDLRRLIQHALTDNGVDDAALESRWIIEEATGLTRAEQILSEQNPVDPNYEAKATHMLNRRLDGEPLNYVFGYKEFYGLRFVIDRHVLSPRPETEMLVDFVLSRTKLEQKFEILDLGTGSGAIAIAILTHRPNATAIAIDVSSKALKVARQNAQQHKVDNRLALVQSDWGAGISNKFDFIVSNPPYIDKPAMTKLDKEVLNFDPEIALFGGVDGLEAYRQISQQSAALLKSGGEMAVEIGFDQGETVTLLFKDQGFQKTKLSKDLSGLDRMLSFVATY